MVRHAGSAQRLGASLLLPGSVLILVSILAQLSVGPLHTLQRMSIRRDMKDRILAGVPECALTRFRFTDAAFGTADLIDGGRELRSEGALYDIVRTYRDNEGMIVIEAVRDTEETRYMADLDRMVRERAAADEQGRQQRRYMIGSWASWFNAAEIAAVPSSPELDRCFHILQPRWVGPVVPPDHGPPRSV